jgi:hypothetical protein
MAWDDDYDGSERSPADPPFGDDDLDDLAVGQWWRQLDVVHVVGLVLAVVAVILLAIIVIQRILGA